MLDSLSKALTIKRSIKLKIFLFDDKKENAKLRWYQQS